MAVGGVVYFLHTDHLESTVLTTDGEGRRVRWGWGSVPTDRRYTGQRWDEEVGLYDYRARWYDPATEPSAFSPLQGFSDSSALGGRRS
ncbi:MAG: hypothetical protein D6759_02455 [Chloroflexi bacterium]|nr:MAG: hypothetical protein D6759_02455 [Chloroflexota bacterium]